MNGAYSVCHQDTTEIIVLVKYCMRYIPTYPIRLTS